MIENEHVTDDAAGGQRVVAHDGTAPEVKRTAGAVRQRRWLLCMGAVAVVGVVLILCEGLVDYFQEVSVRPLRIVFRLLGIAGWLFVLYCYVKVIRNDRKRK